MAYSAVAADLVARLLSVERRCVLDPELTTCLVDHAGRDDYVVEFMTAVWCLGDVSVGDNGPANWVWRC